LLNQTHPAVESHFPAVSEPQCLLT
jgi:hypothetical protein